MRKREAMRLAVQSRLLGIIKESDLEYFNKMRFEIGIKYIESTYDVEGSILKTGESLTKSQRDLSVNPVYWKWLHEVMDITDKIYLKKFNGKEISKAAYEKGTHEYLVLKYSIPITPNTEKSIF